MTPILPSTISARERPETSIRGLWYAFATVVVLVIGIVSTAGILYDRSVRRSAGETMRATARLQSELLRRHFLERVRDARLLSVRHEVWTSADPDSARTDVARRRFGLSRAIKQTLVTYGYEAISVVDSAGRLLYPPRMVLEPEERALLDRVMRSRGATVAPFRLESGNQLESAAAYPIFAGGDSTNRVVGAVLIQTDAAAEIVPFMSQVDSAHYNAETVLGQQEGDSVAVVAVATSGAALVPLQNRIALNDSIRTAAKVYVGLGDVVAEGLDYRGVRVIAAGARVAGTPWIAIAKIDLSALRRQERTFAVVTWLSAGAMIILAGLVLRVLWLTANRRADQQMFELASRYLTATTASIDGFVLLAADGRFLDVNPALEGMTGYSREELLSRSLADLKIGIPKESVQEWIDEVIRHGSSRFHSQWRRKDGSVLEIDVSTTHLPGSGGQLFAFVRDISEQIATTNRLTRLNSLYVFLNKASESLFAAGSVEAAYEAVTRSAVADGHFPLAWVGAVDATAGTVRPVALAGAAAVSEYVKQLHITLDSSLATSQGPAGRAAREGRAVVVNDFANDPSTAPWHAIAAEHGLRACVAMPVSVDEQVVAIVMFYATTAGYFDVEMSGLLGEVSRLLALVVQSSATDQRRRAEEARRLASEERFRRFFEASPVAMFVQHEATGLITRVNQAFTDLFGYTIEDIPDSQEQRRKFYPDSEYRARLEAIWAHDIEVVSREQTSVASPDLRTCCKDGTYRLVQGFVSRAGDELILGWVDMTELRGNQATLQQAEEIARLGSFSYDFRTRRLRTSPDFFRVLGFDEHLRNGVVDDGTLWLLNLAHPDDRERLKAAFRRPKDVDEVVRSVAPGDERRFMRLRLRLDRDAARHPVQAIGTLQDVTADVLATEELTRLRDHLQELVDERTAELAKANAILQLSDRRLKAMLAMSQQATTLNEEAILQLGIDEAARLTDSPVGFLNVISHDQQRLDAECWSTTTRPQCSARPGHDAPPTAGLWADAVRRRAPVLQNEPPTASTHKTLPHDHVSLSRYLVVPVAEGDRVHLVLGIGNKATAYDESDVQELQVIGHDIWSAVSHRRANVALELAYERVQASDQRFAAAMRASSEGVWETLPKEGRTTFSETYETMLGYQPGEIPTALDAWFELLHPDDRAPLRQRVAIQDESDAAFSNEYRMRARDGKYRWIMSRGRVVERDEHGQAVRVIGTHTDLTARREAEEALRRAKEQADAANRAKSAFLAVMSHEIRTPLNGVIAMAEILARSPLPPADMDAVQTIQTSAHALLAVIDDILDFSKIEAGRLELDEADVSLLQMAEDVGDSLLAVASSRHVTLHLFVEPTVPRLVRGDPVRLRQILYNLTGNAIKFSTSREDGHGRVQLRIEPTPTEPPQVVFHVVDNGIGMSDEIQARLFTSFSQGEISTTRKFGGTGLGLAITKRLVALMGGAIEVQSTPGVGSQFSVTLPLPVVDRAPSLTPHDLSGVSCVVVETGAAAEAGDLRRLLEFAGASVHVVPDEAAAAAEVRRSGGIPVVLHRSDGGEAAFDGTVFTDVPHVHHVALTRGTRRMPRVQQPDVVTLDCDVMRPRRLIRAVAVAAGRASPPAFQDAGPAVAAPAPVASLSVEEARARGRLILVAEDDRTNQKVILQQLALLGHAAEVAENGLQALQMWRTRNYALLLSDLHMPELDGYTLTQRIRAEESPLHRLPIVALTANALRGEAARATASGMDGYLTKPVSLARLREVLDEYILPIGADAPRPRDSTGAAGTPIDARSPTEAPVTPNPMQAAAHLQLSVLAGLVGDDPAVIREFVADFQASACAAAEEIEQAHAAGDLTLVGAIAHRLKSSSRAVGALPLGDLCAELEKAGKLGHAAMVADAHRRFVAELVLVDNAIAAHLASA